jgi:hypothetical protein
MSLATKKNILNCKSTCNWKKSQLQFDLQLEKIISVATQLATESTKLQGKVPVTADLQLVKKNSVATWLETTIWAHGKFPLRQLIVVSILVAIPVATRKTNHSWKSKESKDHESKFLVKRISFKP